MLSGHKTRLPRAPWVAPGEDLASISPEGGGQPFTPTRAVMFWRQYESFVASVSCNRGDSRRGG
jgi:hypothetical protein